jgi:hypothetical protein
MPDGEDAMSPPRRTTAQIIDLFMEHFNRMSHALAAMHHIGLAEDNTITRALQATASRLASNLGPEIDHARSTVELLKQRIAEQGETAVTLSLIFREADNEYKLRLANEEANSRKSETPAHRRKVN